MFAAIKQLIRQDNVVFAIVAVYVVFQLIGIGWDLPGTFSWENDGVAPRDLFGGLANNLTPGKGHRYPLFHYLLLAALSLPFLLPAALLAKSFTLEHLMAEILTVPVMTGCAIVAKLLALGMSALTLLLLARIARRVLSESAGRWAVAFAATNLSVVYYGRATNLDGPYLFWTVVAIDRLIAAAQIGQRRNYLLFGLFAALAVATKDQAYATFVLVAPLYLVVLPLFDPSAFLAGRKHWRYLVYAGLLAVVAYGLFSGALLNPTGYIKRLSTMAGSASQDWRQYAPGLSGALANLSDLAREQARFFWAWPLVAVAWLGVLCALVYPRKDRRDREQGAPERAAPVPAGSLALVAWRSLPLVAATSFLLFFTLVVARCEHRFALPVGLWLSLYGGAAVALLLRSIEPVRWAATIGRAVAIALLAFACWYPLQLLLTQLGDARRATVSWLSRLPRGSVVETYGLLVYQPHFDFSARSPYRVQRVTTRPLKRRNPLTGARELPGPFGAVHRRNPDVLVITESYATRFLRLPKTAPPAGVGFRSAMTQRAHGNQDATRFFRAALGDRLAGYRLVRIATAELPGWAIELGGRPVLVHGSTGRRIWILRRARARRKGG